jgi:hypothetical protein
LTALLAGLRSEELINSNIGDLRRTADGAVIHVRGKGNKDRRLPVEAALVDVSINATTEVDLMGQAASETIAGRYWSSSGGQADFARGAMYSVGGKAFLVLHPHHHRQRRGPSAPPSPRAVVTTRRIPSTASSPNTASPAARASLDQRARRLIAIAHPDHRDELGFNARKASLLHKAAVAVGWVGSGPDGIHDVAYEAWVAGDRGG